MSLAVILYEDERGPETEFGLHSLILSCIADELGVDMYAIKKHFDCRPMKGVSKVLQTCRRDIRRIALRGQTVVALIDDDHVRDHLPGIDARADESTVVRTIKEMSDAPEKLEVILLHKNAESVVEASKACDPALPDHAVREALQKNLAQRDRIFHNVARSTREIRACIRAKIPAIEKLVAHLAPIARSTPTASIA